METDDPIQMQAKPSTKNTMLRKEQSAARPKRKRILLVDDHPLMRRGQADLLNREPDFEICGEAGTAREAMEAIRRISESGVFNSEGRKLTRDEMHERG